MVPALRRLSGAFLFGLFLFHFFTPIASAAAPGIELKPIKVAQHTYYFRGESGMASAANQGFVSNAGFVVTADSVVVFDALGTPVLGEAMFAAIRKITPKPISHVIVSHYHADHFYGLQAFQTKGAKIWAHEGAQGYLKSEIAVQRLEQRKKDLFPGVDEKTTLVAADRWLKFGQSKSISFDAGGIRFRLLDSSGAHSDEDVMLFVENDNVLFAGDLYFTERIPFVGNADSKAWLVALDRLLEVKPQVVVPGHGAASTRIAEDMRLTRKYLLYLRKKMGEAVEVLTGFEEAYQKTDWSEFEKYPAFQQANRLNAYGTYILMEQESLNKK